MPTNAQAVSRQVKTKEKKTSNECAPYPYAILQITAFNAVVKLFEIIAVRFAASAMLTGVEASVCLATPQLKLAKAIKPLDKSDTLEALYQLIPVI